MKDKIAFITGAAKGIGRATAVALSASGCQTILTDIDKDALAQTKADIEANGGKASSYLLDVSDREQVNSVHQQALKDHQRIDYFVNNAGIGGKLMPLHLMPLEEWEKVIDVDLNSVFIAYKHNLKFYFPQGGGTLLMSPLWQVKRSSLWEPLLFCQTWVFWD